MSRVVLTVLACVSVYSFFIYSIPYSPRNKMGYFMYVCMYSASIYVCICMCVCMYDGMEYLDTL